MKNIKIKLPEEFLNEETRSDYLVSADIKKLWATELDLLNEFIRVCDKYGLKYYADGGTLLGALRHGGYIPWDDDIDIVMMRNDYDRFQEIAKLEFKHPYFFQTSSTDFECMFHHTKLRNSNTTAMTQSDLGRTYNQGIWIDILPLDNIPDDPDELSRYFSHLESYQHKIAKWKYLILSYEHKKGDGLIPFAKKYIKHIWCKYIWKYFHPLKSICEEFDKEITLYKDQPCKRIANLSMLWYVAPRKLFWQKAWYDGERSCPFEFMSLPVPFKAEEQMEMQYGDWRKMIIADSCHKTAIVDTDKPYTEYLQSKTA